MEDENCFAFVHSTGPTPALPSAGTLSQRNTRCIAGVLVRECTFVFACRRVDCSSATPTVSLARPETLEPGRVRGSMGHQIVGPLVARWAELAAENKMTRRIDIVSWLASATWHQSWSQPTLHSPVSPRIFMSSPFSGRSPQSRPIATRGDRKLLQTNNPTPVLWFTPPWFLFPASGTESLPVVKPLTHRLAGVT